MKNLTNRHPREILEQEFLKPLSVTPYRLAKSVNIQQTAISMVIKGKRSITTDTAMRFSYYFGTTPEFWLNLQREHDLRITKRSNKALFDSIVPFAIGA
ncbi:MAG: HigA family addiction module antitoxin [Cyclobacteriaceae bacterium]|nr:HigA family addiction module antitoxin [Cyclobacteriaceae bacterium]